MSMFGDSRFNWRETYFVLFESSKRPTLKAVEKALSALNAHYQLKNSSADEAGRFESLTLISPEDYAALDVCYTGGAEVLEQGAEMAAQMEAAACEVGESVSHQQLHQYDGRFDVLHFEEVGDLREDEEDLDEMLDPSALLLVLGELAKLTGGVAVDPQTGTLLSNDEP
jgi:hypothetical protein